MAILGVAEIIFGVDDLDLCSRFWTDFGLTPVERGADHAVFEKVVPAKQAADLHTSSFTQRAVYAYARKPGVFEAHVQAMLPVYARRRDLITIWYSVLSAVHYPSFAWRLKLLTWQELASVLPKDLQQFVEAKYRCLAQAIAGWQNGAGCHQ